MAAVEIPTSFATANLRTACACHRQRQRQVSGQGRRIPTPLCPQRTSGQGRIAREECTLSVGNGHGRELATHPFRKGYPHRTGGVHATTRSGDDRLNAAEHGWRRRLRSVPHELQCTISCACLLCAASSLSLSASFTVALGDVLAMAIVVLVLITVAFIIMSKLTSDFISCKMFRTVYA